MKFFIVNKIINCLSLKGSQTKLSASSQANLCTSPKRILQLGKYNDMMKESATLINLK